MKLTDSLGRTRVFSGVNIVDKSDFLSGEKTFDCADENDIRNLAQRGFNLIRLGFTWGKIEYAPGMYNEKYIDSLAEILDVCEKYGVYAFLDMHQDLYSSHINGDGAPRWATLTEGRKIHPTRFVWAEDYFWGRACHRAFDNFWSNKKVNGKGLQDWFADCWVYLIKRLGGKSAVIGFDLLNEPFPGTAGGKCFRKIISGVVREFAVGKNVDRAKLVKGLFSAEREKNLLDTITPEVLRSASKRADALIKDFDIGKYSEFISKLGSAIRNTGTDKIIFLENSYWSNLGIPYNAKPICIGGERDMQQVFAPHAYDFMVDTPSYRYANNARVGSIFDEHRRSQQRLQMPVIVGEWGGFGSDDDETWLSHISYLLNVFDGYHWSNTYWQFNKKFFESPLMKVFVRAYPQAVSGEIMSYSFDENASVFKMSFAQTQKGESVICAPFPIKNLMLDGESCAYKQSGACVMVCSDAGDHTIEISFGKE